MQVWNVALLIGLVMQPAMSNRAGPNAQALESLAMQKQSTETTRHSTRLQPQKVTSISDSLGSGNDVCEPEKGLVWDGDKWADDRLAERYLYKQKKTLELAEWIGREHCIIGVKGISPCILKWSTLSSRVRKFASCAKVPQDDGSKLSGLVWSEGEHNLQDFFQKVVEHMEEGFNGNKNVQGWLEPGNCTFHFSVVKDSTQKHIAEMKDSNASVIAEAITADIFGDECKYKKVIGLGMYRNMMVKNIKKTIEEARAGNLSAIIEQERNDLDPEDFTVDIENESEDPNASLLEQVKDFAVSFMDIGAEAISQVNGVDPIKILLWVLICCVLGPLGWIIMIIVYLAEGPKMFK